MGKVRGLRDRDLLQAMGARRLVSVILTITTLKGDLRRAMEPRTITGQQRLQVIEELSKAGVPVGVMTGPMIPSLNDYGLHEFIRSACRAGASFSAYTLVRFNGAVKLMFHNWLHRNFPDRADKVWHGIELAHGGTVNDNSYWRRMRRESR